VWPLWIDDCDLDYDDWIDEVEGRMRASSHKHRARAAKQIHRCGPSPEAIAAAPQIRNTKAELLDTITGQHKTILAQTLAMAQLSDANTRTTKTYFEALNLRQAEHDLALMRLTLVILIRRQLEKRLWDAVLELLAYQEREQKRGYGYTRAEMAPVLNIRAMFE